MSKITSEQLALDIQKFKQSGGMIEKLEPQKVRVKHVSYGSNGRTYQTSSPPKGTPASSFSGLGIGREKYSKESWLTKDNKNV